MEHWLHLASFEPEDLADLVAQARAFKSGDKRPSNLREKILTMVFFNPSLRTRTSFEAGMLRNGGHSICLNVGGDTWQLEHRSGIVMDGGCAEHIREAAPVLGRYGHALAVRSFAGLQNADDDARDTLLSNFAEYAGVPVVNMESAREHPCQGLADWMTMAERLGDLRGKRFVLSWAPHIKPLPLAVPHSAPLAAAAAGMNVTVAHPAGYDLHESVVATAQQWCSAAGTSLEITHEQQPATQSGDIVYVKSWGAPSLYGQSEAQTASFQQHAGWQITPAQLGPDAGVMHCLPVRRNVVISDAVMDQHKNLIVEQAENRMWAQIAILEALLGNKGNAA